MSADDLKLLFDLYADTPRQGPGSVATTRRALGLVPGMAGVERILDLGCGTGGSTLVLAEETDAHVLAADIHAPFLRTLRSEASQRGLGERITTLAADMAQPPVDVSSLDLIWAEGSAYSIGFENALRRWRPLLRPGGYLFVTELVWFTDTPASGARAFFANEYPDMQSEATRAADARRLGYQVLDTFRLPREDWLAYYAGLEGPLRDAIAQRGQHPVYVATRREAEIYRAYIDDYGYFGLVLQVNDATA